MLRATGRGLETESWRGLRHRQKAKAAGNSYSLLPVAAAPALDPTALRGTDMAARVGDPRTAPLNPHTCMLHCTPIALPRLFRGLYTRCSLLVLPSGMSLAEGVTGGKSS